MPKLTFLRACGKHKLQKVIQPGFTQPYPFVKKVTSFEHDVPLTKDGLRKKFALIQEHARNGDCLLKGGLKRPLQQESRSDQTDRNEHTHNIVIDIDGLEVLDDAIEWDLPLKDKDLQRITEFVVRQLPPLFHDVSYIAHASSSMGLKPGVISLHLDFWTKDPIAPRALKDYLTNLNLITPRVEEQLELTATGASMRYKIDRSLADNSRLIYIAPPRFALGAIDPIPHEDDRLFLVEKEQLTVDLRPALTIDPAALTRAVKRKIKALRTELGLPSLREKSQTIKFRGDTVRVTTNPDQVRMEQVRASDEFVYYNIHRGSHHGDSNAYYVFRDNPKIVFNFKGESNFLFEQADPEAYQQHMDQFHNDGGVEELRFQPLVFRDFRGDCYYNALIDTQESRLVKYAQAQRGALNDWMTQHGEVPPDMVETMEFEFKPTDRRTIDLENNFINKFTETEYMRAPEAVFGDYDAITEENVEDIMKLNCPTIYILLMSMVGDDAECLRHFCHWLAYIFQRREKTQTAWVMQGTQGTGKGAMAQKVLAPLFGPDFTAHLKLRNLDDQFNAWVETNLIAVIDEFKLNDSQNSSRTFGELKNMITDEDFQVRGMRQNSKKIRSYTNLIFFSNEHEVIAIPSDDRRFNVCPRQETPLINKYPDIRHRIRKQIPDELPLFAGLLTTFKVDTDSVMNALENTAKKNLSEITKTTIDQFVACLVRGDMDYFAELLEIDPLTGNEFIRPAQLIVKHLLKNPPKQESALWLAEIRTLYNAMVGKCDSNTKMGKILSYRGVDVKQIKREGINRRGIKVKLKYHTNSRQALCTCYLTNDELAAANDPVLNQIAKDNAPVSQFN